MIKIITIVGTRPEVIRLSRIIDILDKNSNHKLIHTGQNFDFELNKIFFDQLKIRKPDFFLEVTGETPSQTIGQVICKVDNLLASEQPQAILILGDTNSCLAAIPAKRRKIPIFHIEAGNRCFDQRVPEEINRKIVDHISDINLVYSDIARENLLREGLSTNQIIKIGSPMFEVLQYYLPQINKSNILRELRISSEQYFLVSAHREENIDSEDLFKKFENVLNVIAEKYSLPVIVSTHPRTRKKINEIGIKTHPLIHFHKPFGFLDYIHLQMNAKAVLSDSGTITEESSILNFPALNLRETHERQEGMEEAAVMMVGLEATRIIDGLNILKNQTKGKNRLLNIVQDYNVSNVSEKVLRIIHSYTDYVNKVIWKKNI
ncbi:UDP-N-acetylglucosamine 2-epimerase (non-hydrolyzing) [Candidatus Pelagibacter ubique]|nr:UDP-N-acetylglucosamine 2-epimerase (non-hydrolyzing) [Candidatus Pelagibacter ubique]